MPPEREDWNFKIKNYLTMPDLKEQKNIAKKVLSKTSADSQKSAQVAGGGQSNQKDRRMRRPRSDRPRSEFDQQTLMVRRVTRVTAGGKRFNISIVLAIGNHRGVVGVGTGKGLDTAVALEKAMREAKRHLITVPVTKTMSIPHRVEAKYSSAKVIIMPAPRRGIIAGSALRSILSLAGLHDVNAKILSGSKNKLNIARAAIEALKQLKQPKK